MSTTTQAFLGRLLLEKKIVTEAQLDQALKEQPPTGERLGRVLVRLGYLPEAVLLTVLSEHLGLEIVDLRAREIPLEVLRHVPAKFALFYQLIPIEQQNDVLTVCACHPEDVYVRDALALISPLRIRWVLAAGQDIQDAIRQYYGVGADTIDQIMGTAAPANDIPASADIEEIDSEASIGKFINQILKEAHDKRATDIHIEPYGHEVRIRYRVDGVLLDTRVPTQLWHFKESINSRIKIMADLNIAEKRLPQDGRFKVKVNGADLDLRVSFLPTPFGQSAVIRLLNNSQLLSLPELGLAPDDLTTLRRILQKPHGIVFVTGPTGSGKTTTLYSSLYELNRAERKIITIEDPIEYQLKGITQVQVQPSIGLSFANGLRSMLRHDPDIMMVGEVRDEETARIAVQIALTGHLVLSTLHTNDAASGITRLLDMGIEPYLITSAVECFVAQRLVRRVCPRCRQPVRADPGTVRKLSRKIGTADIPSVFEGKGCEFCNFTGYYGREGIYEFLVLDPDIRALILERASAGQIRARAMQQGMQTLVENGWQKIKDGITSPSEILRVSQQETG